MQTPMNAVSSDIKVKERRNKITVIKNIIG
jgi:hypothetical protein